jgi:hypothetical protein
VLVDELPVPTVLHSGDGGWKSNCSGSVTFVFPWRTVALLFALVKISGDRGSGSPLADIANRVANGSSLTPMLGTLSNRRAAPHWPRASVKAMPTYAGCIPPPAVFATATHVEGLMCELETEPARETNTSTSIVPVSQTSRVTL